MLRNRRPAFRLSPVVQLPVAIRHAKITQSLASILYTLLMARLRNSLVILLWLFLASCFPGATDPEAKGGSGQAITPGGPVPSPTIPAGPGTPQLVILSPLEIDGRTGRIFAVAQVNGELKIAIIDARDGSLITAWDDPGQLALDSDRERLVVDRGAQGVALLNATTGETQGTVALPPQDATSAPQINSRTGMVYAFRGSTVYVIDPAIRGVIRSTELKVPRTTCDAPSGEAVIYQTASDPVADRLYLSFITHSCVPWVTATVFAYDTEFRTEIGRMDVDINSQFLPYGEDLFGTSVNRLGPTNLWAWDGNNRWHDESVDFQGHPAGMALDRERKLIYEAIGETIHVFNPEKREVTGQANAALLPKGRLAGHDPASDNLLIVSSTGRLYLLPAESLFATATVPIPAPSPLPIAPVRDIHLAPNWAETRTMAAILDDERCDGMQLYVMISPASGWLPSPTGTDPNCESVTAVAFSPAYKHDSLLFAATKRPPTILRSLDAGRSWTAAETFFPEGTHFTALLPSPAYASDQTLFALTSTGLLYRSRDGGRNWQLLDQRADQVALAGSSGPSLLLYGAYGSRLLQSTNGGDKWQEIGPTPNGEPLVMLQAAPSSGDYPLLYAFTDGGRFVRSLDGGASWNPIMETSPGPAQLVLAHNVAEEQRPVFLLHDHTVTASYDGMASVWSATAADEAGRFRPTAIAIAPDFTSMPYLFAGTTDGQIVRVRADAQP